MKFSLRMPSAQRRYPTWMIGSIATALIGSVTATATAGGNEYIVDSQIISDSVVPGYASDAGIVDGQIIDGSTVVIDEGSDGSYVGDLSTADGLDNAGSSSGSGEGAGSESSVNCVGRGYGRPDLFYNYFTQGNCNAANAQMYLSPLPVPPNVGHTFYTYQPFYPHHYLYWHKDRYHRYYDNGRGMNRTRAVYYAPPVHTAVKNFYWNYLRLPR